MAQEVYWPYMAIYGPLKTVNGKNMYIAYDILSFLIIDHSFVGVPCLPFHQFSVSLVWGLGASMM